MTDYAKQQAEAIEKAGNTLRDLLQQKIKIELIDKIKEALEAAELEDGDWILHEIARLKREAEKPVWSKKTPTDTGYFWWRPDIGRYAKVVLVTEDRQVLEMWHSGVTDIIHYGGEWCGPLKEPGGDAIENCGGQNG